MLFKDISIFSSGGHFVQQKRSVCAILVEGMMRSICVKLFLQLDQPFKRCRLEIFLFLALVAILFSRAYQFVQFW